MPTQIRLEAGGRQPLPPVASSSTGLPNRSGMNSKSQQAPGSKGTPRRVLRAGVRARRKVVGGHQSTSLAEGSTIPTQSRGCRRSDCMTCPAKKFVRPLHLGSTNPSIKLRKKSRVNYKIMFIC